MNVTISATDLTEVESVSLSLHRDVDEKGEWVGTSKPLDIEVNRVITKATHISNVPLTELLALGRASTAGVHFLGTDGKEILTIEMKDVFVRRCGFDVGEGTPARETISVYAGNATVRKGNDTASHTFASQHALYESQAEAEGTES